MRAADVVFVNARVHSVDPAYPAATAIAISGARIHSLGTDWFVEPLNSMLGLYAAVTRQFADGTPAAGWYPEERISLAAAIEYYTMGSAFAEFAERRKGSLTPGRLADLVVLSDELFAIPARRILDARPLLTMVGGRVVHEDVWTS
jgi:predicted amidohydrolase YtcJ